MIAPALGHGLSFNDLYDRDGLARLDAAFAGWLQTANVDVHARLMAARAAPDQLADKDESNLLIEVARPLEDFLGALFGVSKEANDLRARHNALAPLYDCKRLFVQRYVARTLKPDAALALDGAKVTAEANVPARLEDGLEAWELAFALAVRELLGADFKVETPTPALEALTRYAAWALHHPEGKKRHRDGPLFKVPHKLDFEHLVPIETEVVDGVTRLKLPRPMLRHREGFALTDEGFDLVRALDQTNYCIWCHNQGKDSCSRGLRDRKTGRVPEIAVRRHPGGLSARREDFGDESSQERGLLHRRAGDGGGRQSAGRRDRPSHLQRLHEGLHLPEAGAGRHPADRDPHPEGRARPAVGLRDLFAADALESAQPPAADPAPGDRPQRAGGRAGPGRLQPRPPPDE